MKRKIWFSCTNRQIFTLVYELWKYGCWSCPHFCTTARLLFRWQL